MRRTYSLVAILLTVTLAAGLSAQRDVGRMVLPPNEGFASMGGGVTGGSAAGNGFVFVVRTRNELAAALAAARPAA